MRMSSWDQVNFIKIIIALLKYPKRKLISYLVGEDMLSE